MTLIGLMVAVSILGILAAIASPNCTEHVRRGYRTDARGMMTEAAQQLERFRSVNGRDDQDTAGGVCLAGSVAHLAARQQPGALQHLAGGQFADGERLCVQAVPVNAADACGTSLPDQAGTRLNAVGANPAAYLQDCWER